MTDQQDPEDVARDELLTQIADNAKRTKEFTNQVTRSETLKNLAEAYAYLVAPSNSH